MGANQTRYTDFIMPWGKHKGKRIGALDLSYLAYLYEECDLQSQLRTAVESEIARRIGRDPLYRNPFAVLAEFRAGKS